MFDIIITVLSSSSSVLGKLRMLNRFVNVEIYTSISEKIKVVSNLHLVAVLQHDLSRNGKVYVTCSGCSANMTFMLVVVTYTARQLL